MATNTDKTNLNRNDPKFRRKIVLPCVIPWESGSNKYASQKGSGGFGMLRNATTVVTSSKGLSESNDGVVPWINCPPLKDKELASQSGLTPFGGFREHVAKVQEKDGEAKKDINKLLNDRSSERILTIWSQPSPQAKNLQPFGKQRGAVTPSVGGRSFSEKELNECRAAIPRFQDPRETFAAKAQKPAEGFATGLHNNRKTITHIEGLDRTEKDELDSNRYMAWLGGQVSTYEILTLQSQTRTGGFQKPRDVVSTSYYDRVMSERSPTVKEVREQREEQQTKTSATPTTNNHSLKSDIVDNVERSDSQSNIAENGDITD
ncbi:unnamed protein product [Anisakis simplex]|uniref:Calponin-homology (CH) domain-containing protein n=1 Tax=Anisakis simplex TaxID=6269 RepID=A0A0M3K512_ANISI|nr:unnamed protein product [Anisakis simplex]